MDVSALSPLAMKGLGPSASAPSPDPKVTRIEASSSSASAGGNTEQHTNQDDQALFGRDLLALRRSVAKGDKPAGPPPSFEVSLLEVDSDLQNVLARIEANRAQQTDAEAVKAGHASLPDDVPDRPQKLVNANTAEAPDQPQEPVDDPPDPR